MKEDREPSEYRNEVIRQLEIQNRTNRFVSILGVGIFLLISATAAWFFFFPHHSPSGEIRNNGSLSEGSKNSPSPTQTSPTGQTDRDVRGGIESPNTSNSDTGDYSSNRNNSSTSNGGRVGTNDDQAKYYWCQQGNYYRDQIDTEKNA